jgi:hypothetical protein
MRQLKNAYRILAGNPHRKRPFGRMEVGERLILKYLKLIVCEVVNRNELDCCRVQWWTSGDIVVSSHVP